MSILLLLPQPYLCGINFYNHILPFDVTGLLSFYSDQEPPRSLSKWSIYRNFRFSVTEFSGAHSIK